MATDVGCMRVVIIIVMVARVWPMCRSMTLVGKGLGPWTTKWSNGGGVYHGIRGRGISSWCNGLVYKCREESFIDSKTLLRGVKTEREVDKAPVLNATGTSIRVRFAPSPTGTLHVGGARTALYNFLKAKHEGGKFILRIEDTDESRSTRESETSLIKDLRWLGLDWDEGPDVGGAYGPYRQSERNQLYVDMAKQLVKSGAAYPCFSTEDELEGNRRQAEVEGRPPHYDGKWRDADPNLIRAKLEAGESHTYRFCVPKGKTVVIDDIVRGRVVWDAESVVGDFILLRSTGVPVYNFCVAEMRATILEFVESCFNINYNNSVASVDDALMDITHVIRAEEHLTNTLRQCLILDALGKQRPQYAHCSLILGSNKQKLSKRHGAASVDQFRQQGFLPEAVNCYLSLLGWNDGSDKEIYTPAELIEAFELSRLIKSSAVFDETKLRWINGKFLRSHTAEELSPFVALALMEAGICDRAESSFIDLATSICKSSIQLVTDSAHLIQEILSYPLLETLESGEAAELLEDTFTEVAWAVLDAHTRGAIPLAGSSSSNDFPREWKTWVETLGKSFKVKLKGKKLYHPVRLALTGRMSGPDVGDQLQLLYAAAGEKIDHITLSRRMSILQEWLEEHEAAK